MTVYSLVALVTVVTNIGFTVAFDSATRCASWVSYDLTAERVIKAPRMACTFKPDPRVPETDLNDDYAHAGYDRGHMAPAADFNWDTNALHETYYYSNICPQNPSVNRGRWSEIEKELRQLATSSTVHILTFPYGFSTNRRMSRVLVPEYFIKIAYGDFGVRFYGVRNKVNLTNDN